MVPLASASDLAEYTRGKISEDDPRAQPALDGISQAIRMYCGWHIYPQIQETVTLDGPGGVYLTLPTRNVADVVSITEDGSVIDATDYKWSNDGTIQRKSRYWSTDFRDIQVTYLHGFNEVPVLTQVVLTVTARQLASPMGVASESVGGVAVKWGEVVRGVGGGVGILANEYALIDPYRIESI